MQLRRFVLVLAALALFTAPHALGAQVEVTDNSPPEVQLAFIDTNRNPVPDRLVEVYEGLLDTLETRCVEGRTKVADMAVRATQLIERDYGSDVSTRRFLEELDAATQGRGESTCSELLTVLIPMIGEG